MGLSKSFGSQAQTSIKLGKLHTVPTTEDLLFVLSTATQNKKTAELPFSNPNNNASFTVKVTPATLRSAPRWTFERNAGQGNVVLWSRETNEVMMIQGKIKIESNYTGVFEPVQDGAEEQSLSESQTIVEDSPFLEDSAGSTARDGQTAPDQDITSPYQTQPGAAGLGQRRYEAWEQRDRPDAEGIQELQPDAAWQQEAQLGAWQEETKRDAFSGAADQQERGQDTQQEYQQDTQQEYRQDTEQEYRQETQQEYRQDTEQEYRQETQQEFRQETQREARQEDRPMAHLEEPGEPGEDPEVAQRLQEGRHDLTVLDDENDQATQQNAKSKSKSPSKSDQANSKQTKDGQKGAVALPPPAVVYPTVLPAYLNSLCDPATGLLSHGAFEFFLLRDVEYVHKHGGSISLLVFDFVDSEANEKEKASIEASAMVAGIISGLCGSIEHCTQLRTGEFAVLLCGYDGKGAVRFADKICSKIFAVAGDLKGVIDHKALAIGVATIPENCKDPGSLISAASKAKGLAREGQRRCMQFPSSKRRR